MNTKKTIILFSLILLFFSYTAREIRAAELITNGGFETGTFAGWTVANPAGCTGFFCWQNSPAGTSNGFNAPTSPQEGIRSAWNGVAANANSPHLLYQDVSIPAASTASVIWKHRFQLDHANYCTGAACGTATFAVEILNTSNVLLQTLYTVTIPPETIYDSGWLTGSALLTPYAGQTIRLRFRNVTSQTFVGPGMAEIDAVSVQTPSVLPPATAAGATVSGRVLTDGGRGISLANVTLTDLAGNARTVNTNQFGIFNFEEVGAGQNYILTVNHKKYTFPNNSRVINVNEDVADVEFRANP